MAPSIEMSKGTLRVLYAFLQGQNEFQFQTDIRKKSQKMLATTYEDIPYEIRAMIWKYRTVLRKHASTIIFRNIARFVIVKRACRFCLELFSHEYVAVTGYYIDEEGERWDEGRVEVFRCRPFYVEANSLFGMNLSMALHWMMDFDFSVERFVLSPFFTMFAAVSVGAIGYVPKKVSSIFSVPVKKALPFFSRFYWSRGWRGCGSNE